jgi:hypothetical protein
MRTTKATKSHGPLYLAAYEVERCYGGPEEGGWWYDAGRVVGCVKLRRSELRYTRDDEPRINRVKPEVLVSFSHAHGYLTRDQKRKLGIRDRYSVIGGPDIEVCVSRTIPQDYPAERPYYE